MAKNWCCILSDVVQPCFYPKMWLMSLAKGKRNGIALSLSFFCVWFVSAYFVVSPLVQVSLRKSFKLLFFLLRLVSLKCDAKICKATFLSPHALLSTVLGWWLINGCGFLCQPLLIFLSNIVNTMGHTPPTKRPNKGTSVNLNVDIDKALFLSHFYMNSKWSKISVIIFLWHGLCVVHPLIFKHLCFGGLCLENQQNPL